MEEVKGGEYPMNIKKLECSKCGAIDEGIESNNPLVGNICFSCLANIINFDKVEDVAEMSRTLKIDFNPNQFYLASLGTDTKEEAMREYFKYLSAADGDPKDGWLVAWDMIDEEWKKVKDFRKLTQAMPLFVDEFLQRGASKWGYNFSFDNLMKLENLYLSTIKAYGISDPIRRDAVKKAALISLKIDDAIYSSDSIKELKPLTDTYNSLLKMAKVEEFVAGGDEGTIRTVADLVSYLEKRDYHIKSHVVEEKDVVDRTLDNILENTRIILGEATGLDLMLQDIIEKAQDTMEADYAEAVYERQPLEDFMDEASEELELELENEEEEELDLEAISRLFK